MDRVLKDECITPDFNFLLIHAESNNVIPYAMQSIHTDFYYAKAASHIS